VRIIGGIADLNVSQLLQVQTKIADNRSRGCEEHAHQKAVVAASRLRLSIHVTGHRNDELLPDGEVDIQISEVSRYDV
jgi:hypothetical protein